MKNRMVAVLVCFVLMFSVVSCDDQEKNVGYGSLSVEISNSENSKTIQPTSESLAFTSYTIKGRYGTNEDWIVNETFSSKTIKIDHLEVGDWEFVVEGFNTDGVLLAKSEPHSVTIRTNGNAKETYTLDWIDGFGSLKLSVKVQSSRVSSVECQLYDGSGNVERDPYTIGKESSVLGDDGLYLFEKVFHEVPTGFYNAKIVMKDKDGEPLGKTLNQSVHIHDGLESSFGFTWKGFPNLLPQVDVPKPNFDDETSIPCDSEILLDSEEDNTSIFYSFDGKSYSVYTETGIDLSQMQDLSNSIKIWVYAEKVNLNKSSVGTYTFNVEHNPDRTNAVYTWNAIEGGYECVAISKCQIHKSVECEMEKVVASYHVITDSTCSKEGVGRYTAVFANNGYTVQTKDEVVPPKHRLAHHVAKAPTCTETGLDEYDCTLCDYTTYKEIPALGHSFVDFICTVCNSRQMGPAGGYVFYDCDADNDSSVNDGRGEDNLISSECGWRYLEAAPADLCVVNGVPTVDSTKDGYSGGKQFFIFGCYRKNGVNGDYFLFESGNIFLSTKTGTGEGFSNTNILAGKMQDTAYGYISERTYTTSNYAARLCKVLVYEVNGEVFKDWFLPSKDELNLMYENLHKNGLGSFADKYYWSSSESSADDAWVQNFDDGDQSSCPRYNTAFSVRPVRGFLTYSTI